MDGRADQWGRVTAKVRVVTVGGDREERERERNANLKRKRITGWWESWWERGCAQAPPINGLC